MARSLTIAIDASRLTVGRLTGTETYTRQLLTALAELRAPDLFELYLNAGIPPADLPALGVPVCIPLPRLWTHVRLSLEIARRRPGVLFVPAHVVPIVHPRTVVTVHDLGYLAHPEAHPRAQARMLDWTTRWSVRAAHHVIAISDATRRDLIERYHVPAKKITTIHHGVNPAFRPASPEVVADLRRRMALPERYVLAVGTVQPRKNLARLAAAVARLRDAGQDLSLVVAGKRGWMAAGVEREIAAAGAAAAVRWLDYVDESDLPTLYSGAAMFALPSLYEGFGMPLLEAMACGVPVVASDSSALPEIGGNAALYVPPTHTAAIANAISRVLTEPELHSRMVSTGSARAATFSWRSCAERTLAVLRSVRDG